MLTKNSQQLPEVRIEDIDNPILPYLISKAYITNRHHTFIHYLDINKLKPTIDNVKVQIKYLKSMIDNKTNFDQTHVISKFLEHANYLLAEINLKYNNINPNRRSKRGLINVIGKISKWAFGTLDSSDGEYYDNAIANLQNNQNNLLENQNQLFGITKQLMKKFNDTFYRFEENQKIIKMQIDQIMCGILDIEHQTVLNLIMLTCRDIISFLDNIENSIVFARLGTLHTSIIPVETMFELIKQIKSIYSHDSILTFNNILSYYDITTSQVFFRKDKIVFTVHFPIILPKPYNLFHLFPIPKNNVMIIPNKPYLLRNSTHHFYVDNECHSTEDKCIYHIANRVQETDCIIQLLDGKTNTCPLIPVKVLENIIEVINEAILIIIPADVMKIQLYCNNNGIQEIKKPSIISIPKTCYVKIGKQTYMNSRTSQTIQYSLPKVRFDVNKESTHPLQLKKINLDEIQNLKLSFDKLNLKTLNPTTENIQTFKWITASLTIMLTLIILYFGVKSYLQYRKSQKKILEDTITKSTLEKSQEEDHKGKTSLIFHS